MTQRLFQPNPGRTSVKICGITRPSDAKWLANLPIHAVGLNFHPASSRFVDELTAKAIVDLLPQHIPAIGVFVDRTPEDVCRIAKDVGLAAVQLHGDEPARSVASHEPFPVFKAFRVKNASTLHEIERFISDATSPLLQAVLLDAFRPGSAGGTGDTWDWSTLGDWKPSLTWLLAGGITPENAEEAIRRCRPAGIDLASGAESSPGVKDRTKVERLLEAVARADQSK
ncbi:phosphoribosylanthranilate isomerase [bacterium]|nr:phosphoribosylanthranilate isomerase [bacterium]